MITLLTDFGTCDYFVAAIRGSILSLHSSALLVDITHDIDPFDIRSAAFTLSSCYRDFPRGTVHLVVVDPGVGSTRRAIVAAANGHVFVGPDNGVFSFIYHQAPDVAVYEATRSEFFRSTMSQTFHGRDLFAPLAAHLDRGLNPSEVGPRIDDFVKVVIPQPHPPATAGGTDKLGRDRESKQIIGEVIHVDRFGNCITNLTTMELDPAAIPPGTVIQIGERSVGRFTTHFAAAGDDEPFVYFGSAGYWEIGVWCASTADLLEVRVGSPVRLVTGGKAE